MRPIPFALEVKTLRKERGWSQDYLCKRSKVPQKTISRLETGVERNIELETARRLAKALGGRISLTISP